MLALLALIPCLAWIVSAMLALRCVVTIDQLAEVGASEPEGWPTLSVIVPACNEVDTLRAATEKLLACDYPALQLILIDDRSDDGTGALVDALALEDGRVRAVHVSELPADWLGKAHAMQRGLDAASGDWCLFTDADVHFAPDALRRAIAWCLAQEISHLTVIPEVDAEGFVLQATVAGFSRYFTLGQRLWRVNDDSSDAALGVGAFNLVSRAALQRTKGLAWLALDTTDDLALGLLMKRSGARSRALWGRGMVAVHWYPTLGQMIVGLEKNSFPMVGCRLWPLVLISLIVLCLDWTPPALLFWSGAPGWLTATALGTLVICLPLGAWLARWARRPMWPALAVPLGATMMAFILVRAGIVGSLRGGIRWRGTFYPSELLRRGARVTMFGSAGPRQRQTTTAAKKRTGTSTLIMLVLLLCLPAACGRSEPPGPTESADTFAVFTVNYPLAFFARRIGADDIAVSFPAPANVDPAFWQPSADIVGRYQRAGLLLLNGAHYAHWITTAPLPRSRQLDTGAAFADQLITLSDAVIHSHGASGAHSHSGLAATTWLDLSFAESQVRAITAALIAALPNHAAELTARAERLLSDLDVLDQRLLALEDSPPLLASHPVFQYLARRYGLDLRSVHWEPDLVPDAQQWDKLDALLDQRPARGMLWEAEPLPEVSAALSRRGVTVVVYEPCGNRPQGGDLLAVMERNIAALSRALGG